jgi:hypothetical protein
MKGILITAGAALLVAVPATMGLVGNTSFAQSIPVRVPAQATVLNDDHGGQRATSTTEPSTSATEPGHDRHERDDHGGQRPTTTIEPGHGKVLSNSSGRGQNGGNSRTGGKDDGSAHR